MNAELKSLLNLIFDAVSLGEQAVSKTSIFILIPLAIQMLVGDLPSIVSNWPDLMNELKALPGSSQEKDLIAHIESRFALIGDVKAQAILAAAISVIQAGYSLKQAIVA